jgi:hypothetical protein
MKSMSIVFAIGSLITGLIAAYYWYESSKVKYGPDWDKFEEPVDERLQQMGRDSGLLKGTAEAGQLNKVAALWTAFSVVLNCLSAIVSAL